MLTFLKLGGSLITDKSRPRTARTDVIRRVSREIAEALLELPDLTLILGHGSGSFGHRSAARYGTRNGASSREEWVGFTRVWQDAADLNHQIMGALQDADIPAVAFPPSSSILCRGQEIRTWQLSPLLAALEHRLTPVIYGDVCFDSIQGATILSTEELFVYLARKLTPSRILLAGEAPGVWADYPRCTKLIDEIHPEQLPDLRTFLTSAAEPDVTGGMESKIRETLSLIEDFPDLEAQVFSGLKPGAVKAALSGGYPGTRLYSPV